MALKMLPAGVFTVIARDGFCILALGNHQTISASLYVCES
jgi:hypothetical protein